MNDNTLGDNSAGCAYDVGPLHELDVLTMGDALRYYAQRFGEKNGEVPGVLVERFDLPDLMALFEEVRRKSERSYYRIWILPLPPGHFLISAGIDDKAPGMLALRVFRRQASTRSERMFLLQWESLTKQWARLRRHWLAADCPLHPIPDRIQPDPLTFSHIFN